MVGGNPEDRILYIFFMKSLKVLPPNFDNDDNDYDDWSVPTISASITSKLLRKTPKGTHETLPVWILYYRNVSLVEKFMTYFSIRIWRIASLLFMEALPQDFLMKVVAELLKKRLMYWNIFSLFFVFYSLTLFLDGLFTLPEDGELLRCSECFSIVGCRRLI